MRLDGLHLVMLLLLLLLSLVMMMMMMMMMMKRSIIFELRLMGWPVLSLLLFRADC